MRNRINWLLFIITELILLGFLTGHISVTTFYDGGRFYQITVFGQEYTLINEPAEAQKQNDTQQ